MTIDVDRLIKRLIQVKKERSEGEKEQIRAEITPEFRREMGETNVIMIGPEARELMEKEGIDAEDIEGSGPQGKIIKKDVVEKLEDMAGEGEEDQEEEEAEEVGEGDRIGLEGGLEEPGIAGQERGEQTEVHMKYPLIPSNPADDEVVYAWAEIMYDEEEEEIVYTLHEPDLNEKNEDVLERLEERLKEVIDVDFGEMKREEAKDFLQEKIDELLERKEFDRLPGEDEKIIKYYAYRNFVGLGKIEPLMKDKYIEDISCDGVGVPVYIYHRNPDVGSVRSSIQFEEEELDSFVRKLAQRCGRSISMAEPLLDGSLPDGSRVQATLATDIARRGSNFTIRRFTEDPLTPIDLMGFGTIDSKILAYLWMAIENGKSILVAGPTAAGKTSLLNALSLFIPPGLKIVSIEDTPELRLPHPNWVPEVARSGFGFGESSTGEVTLDDLLKESLRQRPDYIIVGEVRGEEAYVLFQQIATGHPGLSTLHASSLEKVMDRLTNKPINLPPTLVENLDLIVFIKRVRRRGRYVRRIDTIYELEGYDKENDEPIVNPVFEWDSSQDVFENVNESSLLYEISEDRGIDPERVQSEIARRQEIIKWMNREGISHYTDVGRVAGNYYSHPEHLLSRIRT